MKYVAFSHLTKIENKIVKTNGIIAFRKNVPVKIVKDVALDGEAVRDLVEKLNKYQVELVHLFDVIEDFLF